MTAFIEKIRANLLTEDDVLREAWLFQLKDYPLVPVELTNELVAFCRTHEAARKKLLLDGENFPKDEQTIELLLEWVHELPLDLVRFVPHFLRNTPAKIIAKYGEQLVSFVGKDFIAFYEQFLPFEAGEADLMELWEPLDDLLHDMMKRFDPILFEQAKVVQDMLIQTGEYDAKEVQETIEIETEDEYGYGGFSENGVLAVRAVGVMQLHQYIPTLAKLLERQGEDLLLDEATEALIRLQSDDVVKAVAPNVLDHEQFIAVISVLKDIKTPLAESVLVEAYEQTNEVEIQEFLLDALIAHFSVQAFPFIEQFIENDEYSGIFDMEELFYSFYKAMNREHPLLEEWKHEVMERNQQFEEEMKQLLLKTAIQEEFGKVGRNDPCVCGSGKKFKKCCGK